MFLVAQVFFIKVEASFGGGRVGSRSRQPSKKPLIYFWSQKIPESHRLWEPISTVLNITNHNKVK